jgi:hypothetical protein
MTKTLIVLTVLIAAVLLLQVRCRHREMMRRKKYADNIPGPAQPEISTEPELPDDPETYVPETTCLPGYTPRKEEPEENTSNMLEKTTWAVGMAVGFLHFTQADDDDPWGIDW